ncbi:hypothetical protein [Parasphingorhabdus pacifica]
MRTLIWPEGLDNVFLGAAIPSIHADNRPATQQAEPCRAAAREAANWPSGTLHEMINRITPTKVVHWRPEEQ